MNIFYNSAERRLRAGWRLLIQWVLFLVGTGLVATIAGILVLAQLTAAGKFTPAMAGDQAFISNLITTALTSSPYLGLITGVGSLLMILLTYWIASRWLDRRSFADFGFHFNTRWWKDLLFGLVLGAGLMVFIFLVEWAAGWVTPTGLFFNPLKETPFLLGLLLALINFLCVGIYEEMLFRGYQLRNMAEGLNLPGLNPKVALIFGYLFSSIIFGLLHLGNPNASLISAVNIAAAGLFLGLGFVLTGDLGVSIGLHIAWNFFQGNVFGFAVSGTMAGVSLVGIHQSGPELWTGGAFGPEAGIMGLLALALGSGLVYLWVRRTRGEARLLESLAIYQPPAKASSLPAEDVQVKA